MSDRPRSARASQVTMTEIVLPADTNPSNHIWGGRVMALMDKAAAIAAMRHCRTFVVTAAFDSIAFREPVRLGQIVRLHAAVNAVFHTSMEVGVKVISEDPLTGRQAHCCSAYATMVSLDGAGRPCPIPPLRPGSAEERRRQREARERRRARLLVRGRRARRAPRPR